MQTADALQTPKDFPYPIILYLKQRVMLLWAKTNVERSFWVDTLQEMITESHPERKGNSAELVEQLLGLDRSLGAQLPQRLKAHYSGKKSQEEKEYDTVQMMSDKKEIEDLLVRDKRWVTDYLE